MTFEPYEVTLAVFGCFAVAVAVARPLLRRGVVSLPMVLVGSGALAFAAIPALRPPDPGSDLFVIEKATEMGVLISLMGAGLALDTPIGWRSWRPTWRLLAITMPLGIAATALLGVGALGLPLASAVLLGSVLAPTDPVIAEELTVAEPNAEGEDVVRRTLTSEAGLNDALAFPFVYLSIVIAGGADTGALLTWLAVDVVVRIIMGVVVGVACGMFVRWLAFGLSSQWLRLSSSADGFVAIGVILASYGLAELVYGYGFLAVFVAAVTFRRAERDHCYHGVLHDFVEQLERLAVVALVVLFGAGLVGPGLDALSLKTVLVGVAVVCAVRPLAGLIALIGEPMSRDHRLITSFFGLRGIGSIYYLAYALRDQNFTQADVLWAAVASTIVVSVVVHGATASVARRRLDC